MKFSIKTGGNGMVNVQLLKDKIKESGMTTTAVCLKTGIQKQTLYNRYNRPDTFRIYEIDALKDVLHLSEREYKRIFFARYAEFNSAS